MGATQLSVEKASEIGGVSGSMPRKKAGEVVSVVAAAGCEGKQKDDTEAKTLAGELGVGLLAAKAASSIKDKALLAEFLAGNRPRGSAPTWANDDALGRASTRRPVDTAASASKESKEVELDKNESDGEYEDFYVKKSARGGSAVVIPRDGVKREGGGNEEEGPPATTTTTTGGGESDLDFLRSKVVKHFKIEGEGSEGETSQEEDGASEAARVDHLPRDSGLVQYGGSGDGGERETDSLGNIISESGRLFVRNLPFTASEAELKEFFTKFGRVADAFIPRDNQGRGKGFGYISFIIPGDAVQALEKSDKKNFQGRLLHVLPAREGVEAGEGGGSKGGGTDRPGEGSGSGGGFKHTREEAKKSAAISGQEESAGVWNALFIRSDTVLAAASESLGVERGEVMERDASNLAVRLALAETRVISDTKQWLVEKGVSLTVLEGALREGKRGAGGAAPPALTGRGGGGGPTSTAPPPADLSDKLLLVKNLPPDADTLALKDMFSRYGTLTQFIVPPSKAIAIVEYSDSRNARRAFAALAYARFQRAPLFLQKAPRCLLGSPPPQNDLSTTENSTPPPPSSSSSFNTAVKNSFPGESAVSPYPSTSAMPAAAAAAAAATTKDAPPPLAHGSRTVFVKNLSFTTTEEGLRGAFSSCGTIRSVRIKKRRNPRYSATPAISSSSSGGSKLGGKATEPEFLSEGYGFVEFAEDSAASRCLTEKAGFHLDGHALDVRMSTMGERENGGGGDTTRTRVHLGASSSSSAPPSSSASAKLIVRNLAFEATRKDVMELFAPFGTLKSVRLPKKFDGKGRGFAFVEFLTQVEAEAAMAALGSVHLYGRHLVLEWENSTANTAKENGKGREKKNTLDIDAPHTKPPAGAIAKEALGSTRNGEEGEGGKRGREGEAALGQGLLKVERSLKRAAKQTQRAGIASSFD